MLDAAQTTGLPAVRRSAAEPRRHGVLAQSSPFLQNSPFRTRGVMDVNRMNRGDAVSKWTRIVAVAAMALAVASGGLLTAKDAMAQGKPLRTFVRLDANESGAPQNDHPARIGAGELRTALASMRVSHSGGGEGPVFDDKEMGEIVPQIATLLGTARPAQDVTFGVVGHHGLFGQFSPRTVTTGRVFVQGGQLNVILGIVQTRYEDTYPTPGGPVELKPGQRARRVEQHWQASAETAALVDNRGDWLRFNVAQLAAPAKPAEPAREARPAEAARAPVEAAPPKPTTADARYEEIQSRLRALDRLKADGLITEEEYRERRRAILQSL